MMKGLRIELKSKDWKKVFNLSEEEDILASFHCSLSLKTRGLFENMMQGTLFMTANSLCFYSSLFSTETKEIIHFSDIQNIIKRNAARIIPNSLEIVTNTKRYFFSSFLNRPAALKTIKKQWKMKKLNLQSIEISNWQQALSSSSAENKEEVELAMKKISSRYEIVKPLGEGSFGKTFIILDKANFRQYVLKRIDCVSESATIDAVKEMVLLRLLRHPYIVGYKDFWREGTSVYLVMEYCQGGDMSKYILSRFNNHTNTSDLPESNPQEQSDNDHVLGGVQGTSSGSKGHEEEVGSMSPRGTSQSYTYIPEKQIMRWLIQTCLAIEHMHLHGTLHRDIKPSNLFLNRWNDIKLGDLGLSYVSSQSKAKKLSSVGTLGYAAPEILKSKPYDSKCDIYALGCTLYEMCTLRSVLEDQKSGLFPVALPKSVYSQGLEKLTRSMVSNNPDKRPSASEILENPLLKNLIGKVSVESEIYSELQQREDENQQLVLKLKILQNSLSKTQVAAGAVPTTDDSLTDITQDYGFDDGTEPDSAPESTVSTSNPLHNSGGSNSTTSSSGDSNLNSINNGEAGKEGKEKEIWQIIDEKMQNIIGNGTEGGGMMAVKGIDVGLGVLVPMIITLIGACVGYSSRMFLQLFIIAILLFTSVFLSKHLKRSSISPSSSSSNNKQQQQQQQQQQQLSNTMMDGTSIVTGAIFTLLYSSVGMNSILWRISVMFSGVGIYAIYYSRYSPPNKAIEEMTRIGAILFSITSCAVITAYTPIPILLNSISQWDQTISTVINGTILGLIYQLSVWLCVFCVKKESIPRRYINTALDSLKAQQHVKQVAEFGSLIGVQMIIAYGMLCVIWMSVGFGGGSRGYGEEGREGDDNGGISVGYCVWRVVCGIVEAGIGIGFVVVGRLVGMDNVIVDKRSDEAEKDDKKETRLNNNNNGDSSVSGNRWSNGGNKRIYCGVVGVCCITVFVKSLWVASFSV
eukprot:TRINITY_DN4123_c2_g1_i1.p1 TRINITY_DN4123_c2_g1~~TRINITY_DN4123_c2_g1_i1.p1  ORF type:complete len:971 (-),score=266.82 TRINITY_DN4123_c2_g1_i1:72-2984(-)